MLTGEWINAMTNCVGVGRVSSRADVGVVVVVVVWATGDS